MTRGSGVGTLLSGWSGVRILAKQVINVFSSTSQLALRPSKPPIQWGTERLIGGKAVGVRR